MAKRERIAHYLSEARKFSDSALAEFEKGEKEKSDVTMRDAAEKAWNAVLQATNALLIARGFPEKKIKTHRDRRLALDTLETKDPGVRDKGLRERFGAREHHLHERCFYDGEYLPESVRGDILKAKEYVEDIEKLLSGV